jgi:hypothetical protein
VAVARPNEETPTMGGRQKGLPIRAGIDQAIREEGAPGAATVRRSKCQAGTQCWTRSIDVSTQTLRASSKGGATNDRHIKQSQAIRLGTATSELLAETR